MNLRKISIVCLTCVILLAPIARADVKTEERTKVELPGLLGGFMKAFGGKAARDGIVSKVALKGNRKMSVNEDTAEIVDLSEEKIYQLDMKKKTYTVLTFEQMRQQFQEAMDKAKAEMAKAPAAQPQPQASGKPPDFDVDFKLQESGQRTTINGYDCREVVATMNVHQKDKTTNDEGAMVVTVSIWLAPRIPELKQLEDFDLRVAQKLYLPFAQEMAADMAPAMAAYPGLKEAMAKLQTEKVNMEGTTMRTVMRGDFIVNPNQSAAPAKPAEQTRQQPEIPRSLGGLLGGLGKKGATRKEDTTADKDKPASFFTSTTEKLSISTTVSDADVAIPAGFKERK